MKRTLIICYLLCTSVLVSSKIFGQEEQPKTPKVIRDVDLSYKNLKYISRAILTFTKSIADSTIVELTLTTKSNHVPHIVVLSVDSLLFSFQDDQQILLESPNKDTSYFDDSGNLCWKRTYTLNERHSWLFKSKLLNQIHTKHIQPQTMYLSNRSKKQVQRATISMAKSS